MWEDEGAWNAYAAQDSYDWSGADWYNDASANSQDWSSSPSWQSYYEEPATYQVQVPQSNAPSWQQSYDWEPSYSPGSTSNPYASQITSGNPGPEVMYQRLGGNPQAAMTGAHYYRGTPGYQNNPTLVDAEHYAFGKYLNSNPVLNTTGVPQAVSAVLPPGYNAAKWLAQNAPEWLRAYMPEFLVNASPPTPSAMWSGMKPAFGR